MRVIILSDKGTVVPALIPGNAGKLLRRLLVLNRIASDLSALLLGTATQVNALCRRPNQASRYTIYLLPEG